MELFKINAAGIITNKAGVPVNKDVLARIIKAAGKSMETAPERQEAPVQTQIEAFNEGYNNFKAWIDKWAPRVNKMKEPISLEQYLQLKAWGDEQRAGFDRKSVQQMLLNMHNYKKLHANISAFYTLKNWTERNAVKQ